MNPKRIDLAHMELSHCLDCPYSASSIRLTDILGKSEFTLAERKDIRSEGGRLTRLRFTMSPKGKEIAKAKGLRGSEWFLSVLVDPERRYVVRGFSYPLFLPKATTVRFVGGSVEYEGSNSGRPIPRKVALDDIILSDVGETIRLGDGDEAVGHKRSTSTYDFETFDFTPKPPSAFELSAFGLPDPTRPNPPARPGPGAP